MPLFDSVIIFVGSDVKITRDTYVYGDVIKCDRHFCGIGDMVLGTIQVIAASTNGSNA